jgi:hypothetical protein
MSVFPNDRVVSSIATVSHLGCRSAICGVRPRKPFSCHRSAVIDDIPEFGIAYNRFRLLTGSSLYFKANRDLLLIDRVRNRARLAAPCSVDVFYAFYPFLFVSQLGIVVKNDLPHERLAAACTAGEQFGDALELDLRSGPAMDLIFNGPLTRLTWRKHRLVRMARPV